MALKVKLMSVPTTSDDLPSQALGSAKPVSVERGIREVLCRLFKAGVTRGFRDWLQPAQYLSTANLLLDGQAHEPVHHNLSLLWARNIER